MVPEGLHEFLWMYRINKMHLRSCTNHQACKSELIWWHTFAKGINGLCAYTMGKAWSSAIIST